MGRPSGARVSGPLQPFAHGFLNALLQQGYSWTAMWSRLRLMGELSSWLAGRGLEPGELTPALVEELLEAARASERGKPWCSPTSERQLLGYLRGLDVVPPPPTAPVLSDPVERLVGVFVDYLVRERGLALGTSTVSGYERVARRFLAGRIGADVRGLERLTTGEVTGFVLAECRRQRSVRSRQSVVSSLRGLLRFLYLEGLTANDLTAAVPSVACWRGASLPRALDSDHMRRLLASCDRRSPVGRRDFAILTVLARLGLRAGEVAALELGDMDWRAGEILVRGKGDRHERLPLPSDVGDALAGYVRHGRRHGEDPHLFLRVRAPYAPLTGGTVGMVVRYACDRAGLARIGVHRLRHTVATETLRAGAPLEEIASLLRHRRQATTAIYAKVDFLRLRELARPWPGGAS